MIIFHIKSNVCLLLYFHYPLCWQAFIHSTQITEESTQVYVSEPLNLLGLFKGVVTFKSMMAEIQLGHQNVLSREGDGS